MSDIKILKVRIMLLDPEDTKVSVDVSYQDEEGRLLVASKQGEQKDAKLLRAAIFRELLGDEPAG